MVFKKNSMEASLSREVEPGGINLPERPEWQADGDCKVWDPEIFFSDNQTLIRLAKSICGDCEVQAECLEFALEREEDFGVWGGKDTKERRKLVRLSRREKARRQFQEALPKILALAEQGYSERAISAALGRSLYYISGKKASDPEFAAALEVAKTKGGNGQARSPAGKNSPQGI